LLWLKLKQALHPDWLHIKTAKERTFRYCNGMYG
jgi:hypothetical protein